MTDLPFIDLVGMHTKALRAEAAFTVLTKPGGQWSNAEVDRLIYKLATDAYSKAVMPTVLILNNESPEEKIKQILGSTVFEYKIINGFDNPELPFTPPVEVW